MNENLNLVQALAELAYSIALADGELEERERKAFEDIIISELGEGAWRAINRFSILDGRVSPNVHQTYKDAMYTIRKNKDDFSERMKNMYINVIEKVADSVEGLRTEERHLIEKFKEDIKYI